MAKKAAVLAMMTVISMAVLLAEPPIMAEAVTCNPMELSPCFGAIRSNQPPSGLCCAKLKDQKPCLCQYYNNPAFAQYINSAGVRRVSSTCKVPISC